MRGFRTTLLGSVAMALAVTFCACRHVPRGNWQLETGRARTIDDRGERLNRYEAAAAAQQDAQLKLLRDVKAMQDGSNLLADYIQQDMVLGARIRSWILSAREFDTRYFEDGTVEVDMGIDLDEVRRIVRENRP